MNNIFALSDRKYPFKIAIIASVVILLIAYLGWEGYWYTEVGLLFIKWHTHLMVFVYVGFLAWFFRSIKYRRNPSGKVGNAFLAFITILFSLFLVESFFVISGINRTYMERVSGYYMGPYTPTDKTHYHMWIPGKTHWLTKPEYSYSRATNSMGFPDREWEVPKDPTRKRILALGDSFTEGDGAPYDSCYISIFRQLLLTAHDSSEVMNAGVCGSDPFDNYINLKDRLLKYKPDIIIQSLGSGDMLTDIRHRGGMERFQKDGTMKYVNAPWWEPLYAVSYTSRLFFTIAGYDEALNKGKMSSAEEQRMNKEVEDMFSRYSALCRAQGISLIIVLHPERNEVENQKYNYDLSPILLRLSSDPGIKVIDLLPYYRTYITTHHTILADYYWKHDGHHNSAGYEMMAETTLQNILPLLTDSTGQKNSR